MREFIGFYFDEKRIHGDKYFKGELDLFINQRKYTLSKNSLQFIFKIEQIRLDEEFDFIMDIQSQNSIYIEERKCSFEFYSSDCHNFSEKVKWYNDSLNLPLKNVPPSPKQYLIRHKLPNSLNLWSEPFCESLEIKKGDSAITTRHQKLTESELFSSDNYLGIYFDNLNNVLTFDYLNDDLSFQLST